MITTLEQLDLYTKTSSYRYKKVFKEIKVFIIILLIVGFTVALFTNWTLFANSMGNIFFSDKNIVQPNFEQQSIKPFNTVYSGKVETQDNEIKIKKNQQTEKNKKLDKILSLSSSFIKKGISASEIQQNNLRQKINTYDLGFNTLPPDNRLIIPKFGKNIPLIVPSFNKPVPEITQKDFDNALYHGVVKYPTTASPGKPGNTLIFGHTSYESWKHNEFATVFQSLGKVKKGDNIQIIREGKLINYKIIEKKVISPKKLNSLYLKYKQNKKNYLTLVGCYPFGSDKDRLVVISEMM